MIPARARGRVDLIINGSFWLGAVAGGPLSLILLKESLFALDVGWRLAFGLGALLGLGILFIRRHLPESPRWLFIHGQEEVDIIRRARPTARAATAARAPTPPPLSARRPIARRSLAGDVVRLPRPRSPRRVLGRGADHALALRSRLRLRGREGAPERHADASRYADAFDRDDRASFGRRAPISLLPLRLIRRGDRSER